jgi:hypothetical protein
LLNQTASLTGNSINPRNTNIFKTPTAREHKYTYKLIARSQEESIIIRKIINRFRYHAYPDTKLDTAIYAAPDLFEISFKYNDKDFDDKNTFLFHPLPCALVAIAVAYNGSSTPIFFQQTGAPVEVTLSLVFKEMELDTKAKLTQRYDIFEGDLPPEYEKKDIVVADTRKAPPVAKVTNTGKKRGELTATPFPRDPGSGPTFTPKGVNRGTVRETPFPREAGSGRTVQGADPRFTPKGGKK